MPLVARDHLRSFGTFCYVWLVLGFFSGTLLLVGPVRMLTSYLRGGGFKQGTEDLVMIGVIVLFVLFSALLAWVVVKQMGRCATRRARLSYPLVLTICAALCLYAWTNPAIMASAAGAVSGSVNTGAAEFVFGPYPDRPRLEQLKKEGYTAVVSLQHPAVLPFEPPGIAEETRAAQEIGLTFIHAPMLPWISANDASLEKVRRLSREGHGKYYVHCGLGRDRANVVKRMLEREGASVDAAAGYQTARTFGTRIAEGNSPMERGRLQQLAPDVFLIPYPNKHEMFGNMLSGQVAHVLLLLDPGDPQQQPWIAEARARFGEFHVAHSFDTLRPNDDAQASAVVRKAQSLPKPLVIVVPFMEPQPNAAVAATLLRAWKPRSAV
jgi:protein tyrosine phosphatase (PTP) superfamily phosphohydrolase (DUF442 family)